MQNSKPHDSREMDKRTSKPEIIHEDEMKKQKSKKNFKG